MNENCTTPKMSMVMHMNNCNIGTMNFLQESVLMAEPSVSGLFYWIANSGASNINFALYLKDSTIVCGGNPSELVLLYLFELTDSNNMVYYSVANTDLYLTAPRMGGGNMVLSPLGDMGNSRQFFIKTNVNIDEGINFYTLKTQGGRYIFSNPNPIGEGSILILASTTDPSKALNFTTKNP